MVELETSLESLSPIIMEQFAAGGTVTFSPKGNSMLPMLRQGIDKVKLSPVQGKLKKYDLPLYRYPSGQYVLHRIVEVTPDGYRCMGDNTYYYENVKQEYLIAVVTAFKRGKRWISVDAWHYRLYCRIRVGSYSWRWFWKRANGWLERHLK